MRIGLQTATTMQCNLVTDIKLVREAGFDEIELQLPKMEKYFAVGFTLDDLKGVLNGFPVTMLDALYPFEVQDKESRARLCRDCERYSGWAQALACGAVQVVALDGLKDVPWPQARGLYASALRELADIAKPFGVALGVEPLVWSPFHSLGQCLEVIDATERDNVKFNVDTFHLWTDGTRWDDVAKLDPDVILSIHVADTNPKAEMQWSDDDRTALPGDGVVPMPEAIQAIKATGFDGVWSVEMWSKIHYEWDPEVLVRDLKQRMDRLVVGVRAIPNVCVTSPSHMSNTSWIERLDNGQLGEDFYDNPYPLYHQLRAEDPVHWCPAWEGWMVTRYDDCVAVLRNPGQFSNAGRVGAQIAKLSRPVYEKLKTMRDHFAAGLINADPPDHTRIRGLLNKSFTSTFVERMRPGIQQIIDELLDAVVAKGQMDAIADLALPLPAHVIAELLGVSPADRDRFIGWSEQLVAFIGAGLADEEKALKAQDALIKLRTYIRESIDRRHREPADDLISHIAQAESKCLFAGENEILATTVQLLAGGFETTTGLIGNGLLALARHPDQTARLADDPSLIKTAVEELLRYDNSVQCQWRRVTEDLEFRGKQIRQGQLLGVFAGAANRDPAQFDRPDELDITRHPNRHISFGTGIHACIGAPLARLEGQVAIAAVLKRFANLSLTDQPHRWQHNIIIHRLKTLPLSIH